MKEATGEISITLITVVAIAVIGGIMAAMWPNVTNFIKDSFVGRTSCPDGFKAGPNNTCVPS